MINQFLTIFSLALEEFWIECEFFWKLGEIALFYSVVSAYASFWD